MLRQYQILLRKKEIVKICKMLGGMSSRRFGRDLFNYETTEPQRDITARGLINEDDQFKKYYNPFTFDPDQLSFQQDIRIMEKDEVPTDIDWTDCIIYIYIYIKYSITSILLIFCIHRTMVADRILWDLGLV